MIDEASALLVRRQNADGGWGAEAAGPSNTESTALAMLALRVASRPEARPAAERALGWLRARQRADGSWPAMDAVPAGSWMTGVAVLALAPLDRERALRGARWLLGQEGRTPPLLGRLLARVFPATHVNALDPELHGWPWVAGAAGWVEPTAHALLALKALRPHLRGERTGERIRDGERLILDRTCPGGGWNYGNARVLDSDLRPFPDTTALALIALQDLRGEEKVRTGLDALERMLRGNRSGLSLALAVHCFELYGRDASGLRGRLADAFRSGRFLGQTRTLSLAVLALSGGTPFFRVAPDA